LKKGIALSRYNAILGHWFFWMYKSSSFIKNLFYSVLVALDKYSICAFEISSVYFCSYLYMGATSERKPHTSFADVAMYPLAPSSDVQGYDQLNFEGIGATEQQEIAIDNCKVTKQPHYKHSADGASWGTTVEYQRDLWHQENLGSFVLHATQNAEKAHTLKLKVNDLLLVRGVPWIQHISLRGGKVQTINHINVTDIEIISRAPRQPTARRRQ
jgi:hypothetical protein